MDTLRNITQASHLKDVVGLTSALTDERFKFNACENAYFYVALIV